ncbi:hypothetical protein SADUNF_Sadunf15G0011100 [Salix dunnii]|uniref:Uncharacterized protein n=1 Tax=Salix dunnii TaxID=1413687 RepID=A0A835MIP6_9ROSI|nr:hypothetical protein SADUNF_Sadunf15G0011100 [Salix dunnii]
MIRRRFLGGGVAIVIRVLDGVTLGIWVMHCHLGLISLYTGSEDETVRSLGFQCGQDYDFVEIFESKMLAGAASDGSVKRSLGFCCGLLRWLRVQGSTDINDGKNHPWSFVTAALSN